MSGLVDRVGARSGIIKNQCSFLARGEAGWVSLSTGTVCPFDDVSSGACFDDGNNYDTSAKKYTAPYKGKYFFWFNIYTAQNDGANAFSLKHNGTAFDFTDSTPEELTWDEGTVDRIVHGYANVKLNVGDYVQCHATTTSDYNGTYSTFGGFYVGKG